MSGFRPYLCISASAGSGKTFQLSHRVLRLLAMQAAPDSIGAYTFSRKAAGEIFDSIVKALREAAESDSRAAFTAGVMGIPHRREDFMSDLRRWFLMLHRLRIGTLDSRISQMLSAVSVELGLPPEFTLMDTRSAEYLRVQSRVLNRIFSSGALSGEMAEDFLQLFSEATHGKSEKNFLGQIEQFLEECRAQFLITPSAEAWRGPEIENPPLIMEESSRREAAAFLRENLPRRIDKDSVLNPLLKLTESCAAFSRSSTWSRDLPTDSIASRLLSGEGGAEIVYRGKIAADLSGELWDRLHPLLEHVHAMALEQVQKRTLALYGFLRVYQQAYQGESLSGGRLAFDDACMLMADFDQLEPHELAYRLDGEISHWLLDEFQDTSRLQWKVLEPFVSEVLQDPEARRSFFYVGDVKQAIYGWRGGDSELFGQVLRDWPGIEHDAMAVSFRSAPPVLELVNRVFTDLSGTEQISPAALQRWDREFEPHRAHRDRLPGRAEVLQMRDADEDPHQVMLEMVRQLPRTAETAILVRTNDEGKEIADTLRAGGFRVSLEGSSPLRDDAAVEAVLAALRQAAHPLDDFSDRFLKLSGLKSDPHRLLQQLQREGITPVIRNLIEALPLEKDAAFSRLRLDRLLQTAIEFDRLGDPSVDRFLAHVDQARPRESEARGVIRIMTVHQSKGLGFDAVIVPVKKSSSFFNIRGGELVSTPADTADPCVSLLPPKQVCDRIPEFRELRERLEAEKTYESLCTLYVAMTRAKQSLQLLLPAPPKSQGSMNCVDNWLAARLQGEPPGETSAPPGTLCLFRRGEADWGRELKAQTHGPVPPRPFPVKPGQKVLSRLEPSREASQPLRVKSLFRLIEHDGRELGSRVHALLERVAWADGLDADSFLEAQGEDLQSDAAAQVRAALKMEALRKPEGVTGLWREKRFESVLPEGWITGIFDRVVLFEDGAWIQDFKTNSRVDAETVATYTPQLQLYRRVLADMLGFGEESVRCQLLFTRTGETFEV